LATLTATSAIASVISAIEFGEIAAQHAPGGHPLFTAIENARETVAWLEDNAGIIPVIADGTNVHAKVDQAIEEINAAAATLRNDPDQPLPATIWPQVQTLPWPWIAAGVGGLVAAAILFQRRGGR
jgi:hypothetical protein